MMPTIYFQMINNKNKCINLVNQKLLQNWWLDLSIEQKYLVNVTNSAFLSFGSIYFCEVPF